MKKIDSVYNKRKEHNNNILLEIEQCKLLIQGAIDVKNNMEKIRKLKLQIW